MSDELDSSSELSPDAYLDGQGDAPARDAMQHRFESEHELQLQLVLQSQIDAALKRLFPAAAAPDLVELTSSSRAARQSSRRSWAAWAVAAVLGGVVGLWWLANQRGPAPYFQPRALVQVFRDTVTNDFQPYYKCDDDERFAAAFAQRVGRSVHLNAMPAGSRMLGLSYPGGLSRDTTAMLCMVDERPVMVFVDRLNTDRPQSIDDTKSGERLHLFRDERDGLVLYEVTPHDEPRAMQYLTIDSLAP